MNQPYLQYFITALWCSVDDDGNPLDDNYSVEDIDGESVRRQMAQFNEFLDKAGDLIEGLDLTDVAHDFWLTRERHGAGFWDGDYPKAIGEALTELAHKFGEVHIYVGKGNKIYID